MSEEYLWDRTGSDPEIEKLETVLRKLAYKQNDSPPLPAKVLTLPAARRSWFHGLRMAFTLGGVSVLILGLGTLVFIQKQTSSHQNATVAPPQESAMPLPTIEKTEPTIDPSVSRSPIARKVFIPIHRNAVPRKSAAIKTVHEEIQRKPEVKFTNEELYAYNQLMLALSITSSKLRIVNDKINGSDGQADNTADSR
jgi:hypothetical protein